MGALSNAVAALMSGNRLANGAQAKAPSGALYSQIAYGAGQPVYTNWDGGALIRRGYERTMYAYRCIDKISTSIAAQPWAAGAPGRAARDTAPLAKLLGPPPGGPNPIWSSRMLWRYSTASYLVLGKWAWLHQYDARGTVVGLWPLQAQHLKPLMADQNSNAPDYFDGYEYGTRGEPGYQKFTRDQISYFWRPSLADYRQPESPIQFAQWDINVSQLIAQFDAAFLQNGGIPAHLVAHEPFTVAAERKAFKRQFTQRFGGAKNAGKVMFVERQVEPGEDGKPPTVDPITVTTLGRAQKDAELAALRDSKIQDLCVGMGVPLSILGDSTRSKFTNMQIDRQNFWETCAGHMADLEDLVNLRTAPRVGPDIGWFDKSAVLELAKPTRFTAEDVAAGLITEDEWRAERNLDPLPKKELEPAEPEPEIEPEKAPPIAEPASPTKGNVIPLRRPDPIGPQLRAAVHLWRDDIATELERRLTGRRGKRMQVLAQQNLSAAFDQAHWRQEAGKRLAPLLRAAGVDDTGVDHYLSDITAAVLDGLSDGGSFDPDDWTNASGFLPGVPIASVEQALMQLSAGRPLSEVLPQIGAS
jgi:phage portal protein BeeE